MPPLQESVDGVIMQVNRDTVLRAANVFRDEAASLKEEMVRATTRTDRAVTDGSGLYPMCTPGRGVYVGECSKDPVSGPAAISFNRKIDAMLKPCWDYIAGLETAALQLHDVARRYGYMEDEIANSFLNG